jgi:transcriptional regulator with PAS, ATPase and Fis domain
MERMVLTAENFIIDEDDIPSQIVMQNPSFALYDSENKTLKDILEDVEGRVILGCYDRYRTTVKVAEALGISQPSASIKINKYMNRKRDIAHS